MKFKKKAACLRSLLTPYGPAFLLYDILPRWEYQEGLPSETVTGTAGVCSRRAVKREGEATDN